MAQTLAIAASIVALWPVWAWCFSRLADRSDDPLGVLALIAAAILCFYSQRYRCAGARADSAGLATCVCFALYALSGSFLPMLVRAGFAMTALSLLISPYFFGKRFHLPTYGLLLLSLPVVATMQFYLGYPLRVLVAECVRAVAVCAGYDVLLQGTQLVWNHHIVGIDPACSGVRMLWTAFFVCFVFAGMNKLSNARTIALAVFTLMVALLGNVFRATLLFMLEVVKDRTDVVEPAWLHAGVGLVLFAFAVVTIGMLAIRLHRREQSRRKRLHNGNWGMVAVGILLAFLAPHMVPGVARAATISTTLDFPKTYNGRTLTPLPLSQQEQVFATNFPGRIGKFSDGRNQLIMRWVSTPTRQLHPSEDCFRGLGYKIESKPNVHDDATNTTWGAFEATGQDGTKLIIRERITDASNNCFTDVSAWYWAATLGKSHGPWLATTIATQLN